MTAFDPDFQEIDASQNTPRNEFEISDVYASGLPSTRKKILLLTPLLAAGSASDGDLVEQVGSIDDVETYAGLIARHLAENIFGANPVPDLDLLCLAEAGAAVAATFTVTITGTATADGTLRLYAGDKYVDVTITEGDALADVATAVYNAIQAGTDFPFSAASPSVGVVTATCKIKGTLGNNYRISADVTAGITTAAAVTQPTIGATDPTIDSTVTAKYQDADYDIILPTWNFASTSLTALKNAAAYMANARRGNGAFHCEVHGGTYAATAARNATIARRDWTCINQKTASYLPTPAHVAAAYVAGRVAAESDWSVPFIDEDLSALLSPVETGYTRATKTEIENGMNAGTPMVGIDDAGDLYIPQIITTATKLSGGAASDVWASPHVFFVLKYTRKSIMARLKSVYSTRSSRKMTDGKLADVKAQIMAILQQLSESPLEYISAAMLAKYKDQIVVQLSPTNPKFIEIGFPVAVILEHRGTLGQMFLQIPTPEALAA